MNQFTREQEAAVEAARRASKICRSLQSRIDGGTLEKHDKSPVTVADFASQALICDTLARHFPSDPVVGEEDSAELRQEASRPILERVMSELRGELDSEEQVLASIDRGGSSAGSGRRWTLDPIDGTKGFLRGGQYAVALALLIDGAVEVGVVACPNLDYPGGKGMLFGAVRGAGAFAEPLFERGERVAIRVSSQRDAAELRVCESVESGHSKHDQSAAVSNGLGVKAEPLRVDSQAKYALVANGAAELYLRLPTRADYREKIWDHAGGYLIVQEAGGTVTDVDGKPLDFSRGRELSENRGVVVSHGPFHQRVLELIASAS